MRLEPKQIGQFLTACAMVLAAGCDKDDRLTGGTNGTEAENAVAIVLRIPDGSPAVGARVVVRPSDAVDSSSSGRWLRQVADSNGELALRIPSGQWILEARWGTLGLHLAVSDSQTARVDTSLQARHPLSGIIVGADSGTRIHLPGLAMSTTLDAEGRFLFPDVTPGIQSFEWDGVEWTTPDSIHSVAVTISARSARYHPGTPLSIPASALPTRMRVPDSLVPENASFLDVAGAWVPTKIGPSRLGFHQVWMGTSATKIVALVTKPDAPTSPFASAEGLRLAWIPELGKADQTGSASTFVPDSSTNQESDSAEGRTLRADLGQVLGAFPTGSWADAGAFTFALRVRLLTESIGSLWLVDWTDSVQSGIRIGIGSGRLRIVAGTLDTSLAVADSNDWRTWAVAWDGRILRVWSNGIERCQVPTDAPADRRSWIHRKIGTGGAMAMSQLLIWNLALDGETASAPLKTLP